MALDAVHEGGTRRRGRGHPRFNRPRRNHSSSRVHESQMRPPWRTSLRMVAASDHTNGINHAAPHRGLDVGPDGFGSRSTPVQVNTRRRHEPSPPNVALIASGSCWPYGGRA